MDTFATGAQEVVELGPVGSQQGPNLLLLSQDLLVLDAQPCRALCCHSQLVSLLDSDQQGTQVMIGKQTDRVCADAPL